MISPEQCSRVQQGLTEGGHYPPSNVQVQRVLETAICLGIVQQSASDALSRHEEAERKLFQLAVDATVAAGRPPAGLVSPGGRYDQERRRLYARRDAFIVALSLIRECSDEEVYEEVQQAAIARAEAV